jgi:hypothetical protein
MTDDSEAIVSTLVLKLPFFVLGVAIGMAIVWAALLWVPGAVRQAALALGG